MKGLRISLLVVVAALMIMGVAGTTYAFHDGGVADCEGCHTMHNSLNGTAIPISKFGTSGWGNPTQFQAGTQFLLKGSDQSSTCLNCHASADKAGAPSGYHVMSSFSGNGAIPVERTPGGDFAWLTISGVQTTGAATNPGNHHGHNIVAADFGLTSSTNYAAGGNTSPGGSYPASLLYCSSCHNPHSDYRYNSTGTLVQRALGANPGPIIGSGSYGNSGALPPAGQTIGVYRFLGGSGYQPRSVITVGGIAFTANPPVAIAPNTYNKTESQASIANNSVVRVAYGSGMSEWCGNCHAGILNNAADPSVNHRHPAGSAALLNNSVGNESNNYNAYLASGNFTGVQSSAYNSLVPYEEGVGMANYTTTLYSHQSSTFGSNGGGPSTGTENVMCVSCHRAHATAFYESTRFDTTGYEEMVFNSQYLGTDNTAVDGSNRAANALGYTTSQMQAAYYDRNPATAFATYQRLLCNKCHAKD